MRRRALACGLMLLAATALATPALGQVRFVLEDGRTVSGEIIEATRNTLTVRREGGGLQLIARSQLEQVGLTTADGTTLEGTLADWRDGRLGLDVGDERVWVAGGRVVEREEIPRGQEPAATRAPTPRAQAPRPQTPERRPAPQQPVPEAEGEAAAPDEPATTLPAPAERASPDEEASDGAAGEPPAGSPPRNPQDAAAGPDQDPQLATVESDAALPVLTVRPAQDEVLEKDGEVVFTVELSRASENPVSIIYSTLDGDATADSDYEPLQGILTLEPGETSGTLRVALLDDDEREDDEKFHLFISSKGDQAEVAQKWVPVVIKDDDGPAW